MGGNSVHKTLDNITPLNSGNTRDCKSAGSWNEGQSYKTLLLMLSETYQNCMWLHFLYE